MREQQQQQELAHLESHPLVEDFSWTKQQQDDRRPAPVHKRICAALLLAIVAAAAAAAAFFLLDRRASVALVHESRSIGFHFQAPPGWITKNPNALLRFNGRYHLFYQANRSWAHATSSDLLQWRHLPTVLQPDSWYDAAGTMSGSITLLKNSSSAPVILYTGLEANGSITMNAATPQDALLQRWSKAAENPLLLGGGSGPTTAWRGGDGRWRTILAAANGAAVFVASGEDLTSWKAAAAPAAAAAGGQFVDFFQVSPSVHALKVSIGERDFYTLGSLNRTSDEFVAGGDGLKLLDHGAFRFSKSFYDAPRGRRVILAELHGFLSVPRRIWLDPASGELMQWPIQEVDSLRITRGSVHLPNWSLASGASRFVSSGEQLDAQVSFAAPDLSAQMGIENIDVNSSSGDAAALCRDNRGGILGPFGFSMEHPRETMSVFFHLGRSRQGLVALVCVQQTSVYVVAANLTSSSSSITGSPWSAPSPSSDIGGTESSSPSSPSSSSRTMWCGGYVRLEEQQQQQQQLTLRLLVDGNVMETFAQGGRISVTSMSKLIRGSHRVFVFNNGTSDVHVQALDLWNMKST